MVLFHCVLSRSFLLWMVACVSKPQDAFHSKCLREHCCHEIIINYCDSRGVSLQSFFVLFLLFFVTTRSDANRREKKKTFHTWKRSHWSFLVALRSCVTSAATRQLRWIVARPRKTEITLSAAYKIYLVRNRHRLGGTFHFDAIEHTLPPLCLNAHASVSKFILVSSIGQEKRSERFFLRTDGGIRHQCVTLTTTKERSQNEWRKLSFSCFFHEFISRAFHLVVVVVDFGGGMLTDRTTENGNDHEKKKKC